MSSKLITINSFVNVSFLCDFEMMPVKLSDSDALTFLKELDLGKYSLSSLTGSKYLNSVYQETPIAKLVNAIVATHINEGSSGLTVDVSDYSLDTEAEPVFKLPWVNLAEFAEVSSLSTNFCNLKLLKSPDGCTFMIKGAAPKFMAGFLRTAYGSAKVACTEFEDKYQRSLEAYESMLGIAGDSCIGLPDTMPDVYTVHTKVGDVIIYRDDRLSRYGSTTHTIHMPWKSIAVRACFKGTKDLQEWVYKELLEALWMELGIIDEDTHYGY